MKKEKSIGLAILLTIITCGIYSIVWFIKLTDDARDYSEDQTMTTGGMAFLFGLITCGIYSFFWAYKMGEQLKKAGAINKADVNDNAVLYLILQLFGLSIINFAIMQNDINKITRIKNNGAKAQ